MVGKGAVWAYQASSVIISRLTTMATDLPAGFPNMYTTRHTRVVAL